MRTTVVESENQNMECTATRVPKSVTKLHEEGPDDFVDRSKG